MIKLPKIVKDFIKNADIDLIYELYDIGQHCDRLEKRDWNDLENNPWDEEYEFWRQIGYRLREG